MFSAIGNKRTIRFLITYSPLLFYNTILGLKIKDENKITAERTLIIFFRTQA